LLAHHELLPKTTHFLAALFALLRCSVQANAKVLSFPHGRLRRSLQSIVVHEYRTKNLEVTRTFLDPPEGLWDLGLRRDPHDRVGTCPKFLVDLGPRSAVTGSSLHCHRNIVPPAWTTSTITEDLNVRVVREPLAEVFLQLWMLPRHDEQVARHRPLAVRSRGVSRHDRFCS
jgi:hypothetical protein